MIGDLSHIQRINKWDQNQVGNFEVYLDDFFKAHRKRACKIRSKTPSNLDTQTIEEKFQTTFRVD